jgi:polysaccharide deacetylase family protein (PEP-CTERM system associated)
MTRARSSPETAGRRTHVLTVALEDYFHVGAFHRMIQPRHWNRFETRFEQNTLRSLDLLDRFGATATFFVLGWVAKQRPDLVREVAARGHEIANRGYYHRGVGDMGPDELRDDLLRAGDALERATGVTPAGYRLADGSLGPEDLWVLDVLAEEGYAYDSSLLPAGSGFRDEPWRRFPHRHGRGRSAIWEVPLSSAAVLGWHVPIAGGNYVRQLPLALMRRAAARWDRRHEHPLVMYFHVWELDPDQPRIAAPALARLRHYRNLRAMPGRLEHYLARYRFRSIAEHLGVGGERARTSAAPAASLPSTAPAPRLSGGTPGREAAAGRRVPVSVVVPCFNEAAVLPYLANTLRSVKASLEDRYELTLILVDDGSTDGTATVLASLFGGRPDCVILRHPENRGVAAAILTGIEHARTEVVCSIDCDCTYDPHDLARMLPLLADGVDLVTASPYHRLGAVTNVPAWRLGLSRAASGLYRHVLRQKLATYTSCFRVYRRSAVVGLPVREGGFLGVAELLGLLDLRGGRIVECPAVLEARLLGRSKMKAARAVAGHLRLLARLLALRLTTRPGRPDVPAIAAGPPDPSSDNETWPDRHSLRAGSRREPS